MRKELKTTIFDTVGTLKNLFVRLLDNNESNKRNLTKFYQHVTNVNAERREGKCKIKELLNGAI